MYLIKSHDSFFMEKILNLLMQKNFPINIDNKSRIYGTINFKFSQDTLSIKYENDVLNLNTPTDFNKLWKGLYKLLLNHKIILNNLEYFPLKEEILFNNNSLKLRNTHNQIIKLIIQSKNHSIIKEDLYKGIWPLDKEIQINKLDTHLTNLKNLLKDSFNYDLKFKTNAGVLTFIFD